MIYFIFLNITILHSRHFYADVRRLQKLLKLLKILKRCKTFRNVIYVNIIIARWPKRQL